MEKESGLTLRTEVYIAENPQERLDAYLASLSDASRTQIQRWIREGLVLQNDLPAKPNQQVRMGDVIRVSVPLPKEYRVLPEPIPLDVVYEDAAICVINKPVGLVVHPAPGHETGTLVNALLYHLDGLSGVGGVSRPGIVHRIDRMTSGLLVVAKNDAAHERLSRQFHDHSAHREYVTLVHGNLKEDAGSIDAPIGRHPTDRKRMAVVADGRRAVTHWRVLERYGCATLLDVRLETGRTHQIRVHMAYSKHPVLGDPVYGTATAGLGLQGQALHGYRLYLTHPVTGDRMRFLAPPPESFQKAMRILGSDQHVLDTIMEDDE